MTCSGAEWIGLRLPSDDGKANPPIDEADTDNSAWGRAGKCRRYFARAEVLVEIAAICGSNEQG